MFRRIVSRRNSASVAVGGEVFDRSRRCIAVDLKHPDGVATVLRRRGVFNGDELRDAIERLPPQDYLAASYYERWLGALEMLVAEKGVA